MAQAIVNKLLHGPTSRLKQAAASGDSGLPGAAAELFGIEPESDGAGRPDANKDEGRAMARAAAGGPGAQRDRETPRR